MKILLTNLLFLSCLSLAISCNEGKPRSSDASSDLSKSESSSILTDENPNFTGTIEEKIKKYQAVISERNPELNFLRNSEDKLSKMILLNSARGCMLEKKLESLEISIGGDKQPDRSWGKRKRRMPSTGNPDEIVVEFAPGISMALGGNGLFKNKNHSSGSLSSHRVADLAYVKFKKSGRKFENKRKCRTESSWFGFNKREKCEYEIDETNIWYLNEVKIKANGTLIYDRGSVNHTFDQDPSEWKDGQLKENRAYIEMLSKIDCE